MPKLSASGTPNTDDSLAPGIMAAAHSDTFEVSTRLTLNLLKASITEIQTKVLAIDGKVDTVLANTAPRHPCIFCDGNNDDGHRTTTCPEYSDPISRTLRLRDLNKLFSPVSGIRMKVTTSYPVIHLYGAKHLKCKGKQGEEYGSGKGLAIEAQFHTAALNYPHFPSIRVTPEQPYLQEIVYSFSTESCSED